jgi:hypothetical protein
LLGDEKDKHFWRNVVTDPAAFKASLLAHLEMTASDFVDLAKKMCRYRDKFVAHLDSDAQMNIPLGWPPTGFIMGTSLGRKPTRVTFSGLLTQATSSRKATSNV